jgi:hypothetical protein
MVVKLIAEVTPVPFKRFEKVTRVTTKKRRIKWNSMHFVAHAYDHENELLSAHVAG